MTPQVRKEKWVKESAGQLLITSGQTFLFRRDGLRKRSFGNGGA